MIVKTLNFYDFRMAFYNAGREDDFTYDALEVLYNYYETVSDETGEPFEMDAVGICCDWMEFSDLEKARSMVKFEEEDVIPVPNGNFLVPLYY